MLHYIIQSFMYVEWIQFNFAKFQTFHFQELLTSVIIQRNSRNFILGPLHNGIRGFVNDT